MFRGPGWRGREAKASGHGTLEYAFFLGHYHPPTVCNHRHGPKCPHLVYTNSAVVRGFGAWGMVASQRGSRVPVIATPLPHPHPCSCRSASSCPHFCFLLAAAVCVIH